MQGVFRIVHWAGKRGRRKIVSGCEAGEELGGRLSGIECAAGAEAEGGVEREEPSAGVSQEFLAGGIVMAGGGGEEEEGLVLAGDEFGDHAPKGAGAGLDGENRGQGVSGPGSELVGVRD